MANFTKYFSPSEVNNLIPDISQIIEEINQTKSKLLIFNNSDNLSGQDTIDLMNLNHQLNSNLKEIEEMGCFYSEITNEVCLIEFPSIINSKDVYLCWISDEFFIRYYREIDDDTTVRKTIPNKYLD